MTETIWPHQVGQGLLGGLPERGNPDTPKTGVKEAGSGCWLWIGMHLSADRDNIVIAV